MRTLSEILIEADATNDILKLKNLADELHKHKTHYKLMEVTFGLEHILHKGNAIKARLELDILLKE